MSVETIIEELHSMENEIRDLKRSKAQAEMFLAAVMKNVKEVSIKFDDLKNSDSERVKILNNVEDPRYSHGNMLVFYEIE